MKSFKIGDRVMVRYVSAHNVACKTTARIAGIINMGAVQIEKDILPGEYVWVHPIQCRKLVKRERRRVWVEVSKFDARVHQVSHEPIPENHKLYGKDHSEVREFIEVKKK